MRKHVNLSKERDPDSPNEEDAVLDDKAKASYIKSTLDKAMKSWRYSTKLYDKSPLKLYNIGGKEGAKVKGSLRRPKAIVFSIYPADLDGVATILYRTMGDSAICEHRGDYRSSELSRFRNSKKKYRVCPYCGHHNSIISENCEKLLYMVEYMVDYNEFLGENTRVGRSILADPGIGGHGAFGPGGHYVGKCLHSPVGCLHDCDGLPNPFYDPKKSLF